MKIYNKPTQAQIRRMLTIQQDDISIEWVEMKDQFTRVIRAYDYYTDLIATYEVTCFTDPEEGNLFNTVCVEIENASSEFLYNSYERYMDYEADTIVEALEELKTQFTKFVQEYRTYLVYSI